MPPMPTATRPRTSREEYRRNLATLSEASVHQHFDAFEDIDWDNPDFVVRRDDERWILGPEDNLGAHPWYRSLPKQRQIEIGIYRWALLTKVGLTFEQLLIAGIMFGTRTCATATRSSGTPCTRRPRSATTSRCSRSSSTGPAWT